jgi:hypothetical protein
MTPAEAASLLTIAAAFDNRKPDADAAKAWSIALDGIRFTDARDAVVAHYRGSSEWLMPNKIIAEVRRIRAKRIEEFGYITPPYGLTFEEEQAYTKAIRDRVGAGDLTREQYDTELRAKGITGSRGMPTRRELEAVFQRIPADCAKAETEPTPEPAEEIA